MGDKPETQVPNDYVLWGRFDGRHHQVLVTVPSESAVEGVWTPGQWNPGQLSMILGVPSKDDIAAAEAILRRDEQRPPDPKVTVLLQQILQHVFDHDGSDPDCLKCFLYREATKLVEAG